jgi:hypothetical protein
MPRQRSFFEAIEAQGREVLKMIDKEIVELERRLGELRDQAARWAAAVGASVRGARRGPGRPPGRPRGRPPGRPALVAKVVAKAVARKRRPAKRSSPPVDWEAVLKRLPKKFSKDELARATPKLKAHPQARVIAVARWSRSGQIKKVADGQYQKA